MLKNQLDEARCKIEAIRNARTIFPSTRALLFVNVLAKAKPNLGLVFSRENLRKSGFEKKKPPLSEACAVKQREELKHAKCLHLRLDWRVGAHSKFGGNKLFVFLTIFHTTDLTTLQVNVSRTRNILRTNPTLPVEYGSEPINKDKSCLGTV